MEEAADWARRLAEALRLHGIRVDRIILFGSVARGDHAEWSDVDLIVVSRDWEGMSMGERLSLLYRLWSAPRDATFIPLTPGELERRARESVVIREALMQGVEVYPCPEGLGGGEGDPAEGPIPGEGG